MTISFQGSVYADCIKSDVIKVDPKFFPSQTIHQGSTGTCYAHSFFFLLQYLNNQKNGHTDEKFSLSDVILTGCKKEMIDWGNPYKLAHHLSLYSGAVLSDKHEFNLSRAWEFAAACRDHFASNIDSLIEPVHKALARVIHSSQGSLPTTDQLQQDLKTFYHLPETEQKTLPTTTLLKYLESGPEKIAVPSFNTFVLHPTAENFIDEITKRLSQNFPVSAFFCSKQGKSGNCETYHVASLVEFGKKTNCSQDKENGPYFTFHDSANGNFEDIPAAELIEKSMGGGIAGGYTFITPCTSETCVKGIQGDYPLHYLAATGDEKAFQKALAEVPHDQLEVIKNGVDAYGNTLLQQAIAGNSIDIVKSVITPDALKAKNKDRWSTFHFALTMAADHEGQRDAILEELLSKMDADQLNPDQMTYTDQKEIHLVKKLKNKTLKSLYFRRYFQNNPSIPSPRKFDLLLESNALEDAIDLLMKEPQKGASLTTEQRRPFVEWMESPSFPMDRLEEVYRAIDFKKYPYPLFWTLPALEKNHADLKILALLVQEKDEDLFDPEGNFKLWSLFDQKYQTHFPSFNLDFLSRPSLYKKIIHSVSPFSIKDSEAKTLLKLKNDFIQKREELSKTGNFTQNSQTIQTLSEFIHDSEVKTKQIESNLAQKYLIQAAVDHFEQIGPSLFNPDGTFKYWNVFDFKDLIFTGTLSKFLEQPGVFDRLLDKIEDAQLRSLNHHCKKDLWLRLTVDQFTRLENQVAERKIE